MARGSFTRPPEKEPETPKPARDELEELIDEINEDEENCSTASDRHVAVSEKLMANTDWESFDYKTLVPEMETDDLPVQFVTKIGELIEGDKENMTTEKMLWQLAKLVLTGEEYRKRRRIKGKDPLKTGLAKLRKLEERAKRTEEERLKLQEQVEKCQKEAELKKHVDTSRGKRSNIIATRRQLPSDSEAVSAAEHD